MIRNRYLLLFFLFLGLSSYSQSSKIKWGLYGKKTVEERRATFPFSEAKKVVLVAFLVHMRCLKMKKMICLKRIVLI